MIVEAGGFRDRFGADPRSHYVKMNGANVFNFTIKVVPPLIQDTLRLANRAIEDVDYYVFHQLYRFIIKHLIATCSLPPERVPIVLDRFGNPGGPSVPLTVTQGLPDEAGRRPLWLMMLGYGAGLSWAAALVQLPEGAVVRHIDRLVGPGRPAMTNTDRGFLDFEGRSVVVTGASSGLGRACAEEASPRALRCTSSADRPKGGIGTGRSASRSGRRRA